MKTIKLILFLGIIITLAACNKNELNDVNPNDVVTMDDLNVSSGFNWQTYETYDLSLKSNLNSMVEIMAGERSIQKVFLSKNESYTTKITLPTYVNSIILKHLGSEITLDLDAQNLTYVFNN
jgi:hypothetical protein